MISSGSGPGGDFNGPTIKEILGIGQYGKSDHLLELEDYLPKYMFPCVMYLRRRLHQISTARVLSEDYQEALNEFKCRFN